MNEEDAAANTAPEVPDAKPPELPRYEKPHLRRHDQIDQVRPYGPSEI